MEKSYRKYAPKASPRPQDIVTTLSLPSLLICITSFSIGTEKILYFSLFSQDIKFFPRTVLVII